MHPNATTLQRFYDAFAALDADTMTACYAPDAAFDDEAFSLRGQDEIGAMWHMLADATRAKGADVWRLEASGIEADDRSGRAHWEAWYRFSATGRLVHNVIDGSFEFDGQGRIRRHIDRFDFWRWSRQSLGLPGLLLGWSGGLKNKVRATAAENLRKYRAAKGTAV